MTPYYQRAGVAIYLGDCQEIAPSLPPVHAVVTDPPYGLSFMGKGWDRNVPGVEFWQALRLLPGAHVLAFGGTRTYHRMVCAIEDAGLEIRDCLMWLYGSGFPKSLNLRGDWQGWGTALKPAHEPIVLARAPLVGTVAQNVQHHGTGAINVDGCRIAGDEDGSRNRPPSRLGSDYSYAQDEWKRTTVVQRNDTTGKGRWPANVLHDGSEEVLALFPQAASGGVTHQPNRGGYEGGFSRGTTLYREPDAGSAARFFYCAKASRSERGEDNTHPTVKPLALLRYLVTLVTPPGGTVLDPFTGSGSTLLAAHRLHINAIGIEIEERYCEIAAKRLEQDVLPLEAAI